MAAVGAGIITFGVLFKPFFGEKNDFWECVCYILKPNFISWLDKDLDRDYGKSFKIGIFFVLCVGAGFLAHCIMMSIIS